MKAQLYFNPPREDSGILRAYPLAVELEEHENPIEQARQILVRLRETGELGAQTVRDDPDSDPETYCLSG